MQTTSDKLNGDRACGCHSQYSPRLTRHADRRAQQRAISKACIPLVRAYGKRQYDGHGGVTYLMTDDAVQLLIRAVGRTSSIDRLAGVYIVVDADNENVVITIGHCW